jgi:polysaccharide biosynthesis/export protein
MFRMILVSLTLLLMVAGCASPPKPRAGVVVVPTSAEGGSGGFPLPDSISPEGAYQATSDYRLGPQDLIRIEVFQADELDRTVRVNTRGEISLPLLGVISAGGKTVAELEEHLAERLGNGFLHDPHVSIFVEEYTSQRVTVEGAINKPGIYPLQGRTSLLQAVAIAGGPDQVADERSVVVFRTIEGVRMAALFDLQEIRAGRTEDPQIYGDDMVVILTSGAKSMMRNLRGYVGFRPL